MKKIKIFLIILKRLEFFIIKKFDINKINEDSIIYHNKEFKRIRRNIYIKKDNLKRIIYKCINNQKNERYNKLNNHKAYCNGTIEYIFPNQNVKSWYFLIKEHSEECYKGTYIDDTINAKINLLKE